MTKTEELIEIIEDGGEEWYNSYELSEVITLINSALTESPDESEIVILLSLIDPDLNAFQDGCPLNTYKERLKRLKKELKKDAKEE